MGQRPEREQRAPIVFPDGEGTAGKRRPSTSISFSARLGGTEDTNRNGHAPHV